MKRSDIKVGAELAFSRDNDWQVSPFRITKVTVADTRGWTARRRYQADAATVELGDGTEVALHYICPDAAKQTVLVRRETGDLAVVPINQLRGAWEECLEATRENARAENEKRRQEREQDARVRVQAAAAALKAAGVEVGWVSDYDQKLTLGPKQLEQILALINN